MLPISVDVVGQSGRHPTEHRKWSDVHVHAFAERQGGTLVNRVNLIGSGGSRVIVDHERPVPAT